MKAANRPEKNTTSQVRGPRMASAVCRRCHPRPAQCGTPRQGMQGPAAHTRYGRKGREEAQADQQQGTQVQNMRRLLRPAGWAGVARVPGARLARPGSHHRARQTPGGGGPRGARACRWLVPLPPAHFPRAHTTPAPRTAGAATPVLEPGSEGGTLGSRRAVHPSRPGTHRAEHTGGRSEEGRDGPVRRMARFSDGTARPRRRGFSRGAAEAGEVQLRAHASGLVRGGATRWRTDVHRCR